MVEVLIASSIGLGLLLVIYSFLDHSLRMSELMISRVQLNAEARQAFDLLADGGVRGGQFVAGLRGSGDIDTGELAPSGAVVGRLAQKLVIDAGAVGLLESTDLNSAIDCSTSGQPHPDCAGTGAATIEGFLGAAPVIDDGVRNLVVSAHCAGGGAQRPATAEVTLELVDPHLLGAQENYIASQYRARFHNVFAFHVDCVS